MDRACSTHGEKHNSYRILVGKPEERLLGRGRCKLEKEKGRRGMHTGYWCESQKERDH
jgi:hypothetical protein